MTTPNLVYILIAANHEGFNFIGVYDTKDGAIQARDEYNRKGREYIAKLYADVDDPENLKMSLEFFDNWDSAEVHTYFMNSTVR